MDPALLEYLSVWREGGDAAVVERWPDDPFVVNYLQGNEQPASPEAAQYLSPEAVEIDGCPSRRNECRCLSKPAACDRDGVTTGFQRCLRCVGAYNLPDRQPDSGPKTVPDNP